MAAKKRCNLQDVAKLAGVSVQTASNVITGKSGEFQEETRARVLQAAITLGYRPNAQARSLRTGGVKRITLVASAVWHKGVLPYHQLIGIQNVLEPDHYHLDICRLQEEKLGEKGYLPSILNDNAADGFLIQYIKDIPEFLTSGLQRIRLPFVWINCQQPEDCVCFNDLAGGYEGTLRLLERGHREILFVNFSDDLHYSVQDRRAGYEQAMREYGLTPRSVGDRFLPYDDCLRLLRAEFATRRPTAVISLGREVLDMICWNAAALKIRKLPDDLSMLTFSDLIRDDEGRTGAGAPYALMCTPMERLGTAAAHLLLEKIRMPGARFPRCEIPLEYYPGASIQERGK